MKILLAADGSYHSRIAESLLAKLPEVRQADIIVASVTAPFTLSSDLPGGGPPEDVGDLWTQIKLRTELVANEASARLSAKGLKARPASLVGNVTESLLDLAKEEGVDLIAVGSRGENAVVGFLLGSTARRLLAYSDVSVLVGRCDADSDAESTVSRLEALSRLSVLLAYDGSEGSELSLKRIVAQGPGAFEKCVAACAEPLVVLPFGMTPLGLPHSLAAVDDERSKALVAGAKDRLDGIADTVTAITRLGRPANVLITLAAENHCDLISLGATRHGLIERFLLGSVSHEVATSAPCSVLVVRPSAA